MKKSVLCLLQSPAVILLVIASLPVSMAAAQKSANTLKIGVYDSRVVVFAYSRSTLFREHIEKFTKQSDSATKASDTASIKELSVHSMSYQHLLHQMVFGSGSIITVMDLVRDRLPEVAKQAGVSVLMSKFEMMFKDPSVETVDVTSQIIQLFKPNENLDKMITEIYKNEPIPLDDLDIEADMIDSYCSRFGGK